MVDIVPLRHVFLPVFRFYPVTVIPHLIHIHCSYIALAVDCVYSSPEALWQCTTPHVCLWQKAAIRIVNRPEKLRVVRFNCAVSLSLRHRTRRKIQDHFFVVPDVTFVLRIQEVLGWNLDPEARYGDGGGAVYE